MTKPYYGLNPPDSAVLPGLKDLSSGEQTPVAPDQAAAAARDRPA
jgi:hypothetical protein